MSVTPKNLLFRIFIGKGLSNFLNSITGRRKSTSIVQHKPIARHHFPTHIPQNQTRKPGDQWLMGSGYQRVK